MMTFLEQVLQQMKLKVQVFQLQHNRFLKLFRMLQLKRLVEDWYTKPAGREFRLKA